MNTRSPETSSKTTRHGAIVPDPQSDGAEFDAREWPFFWLTHATGLYLSRLERGLKKVDLDIGRWRVLMCVQPGRALSVSEISELAIVKLPTMMKLIQRMEAEGLVSCEARVTDGRVTDVSLTDDGLAARTRAWHVASKIFTRVFTGDDGMEFDALNRQLRQVIVRLEDD
jgi:DNA-binding MarR family transcriptional regulator